MSSPPAAASSIAPTPWRHLKANGIAVHLDIAVERLKRGLHDVDPRRVVIAPGQTIEGLFAERRPLYTRYADATVVTDGLTPDQVVGQILAALGRLNPP